MRLHVILLKDLHSSAVEKQWDGIADNCKISATLGRGRGGNVKAECHLGTGQGKLVIGGALSQAISITGA